MENNGYGNDKALWAMRNRDEAWRAMTKLHGRCGREMKLGVR